MSSPTSPHRPHDPAGRPVRRVRPETARLAARRVRRPTPGGPVDLVARIGTAVTLVAMMIVVGSAFAMVDGEPVPTGAATAGH